MTIDPEVVDPNDVEMLQDLVVTAVREAIEKATALRADRMKDLNAADLDGAVRIIAGTARSMGVTVEGV